jgi:uracil-DNA glycosylase
MASLKRKAGNTTSPELESKKPKSNGSIASFFGAAPKPAQSSTGTASQSPAVKFDKAKWVASLTSEQKELLTLEIETLDESWLALLKDDIVTKEFLDLKRYLERENAAGKKWFPPKEDVYSWLVASINV